MPDRSEHSPPPGGDFARLARLALKELREILRDRRTILTLVLMPILVYPLLGVVLQKFLLSSLPGLTSQKVSLAFESEREAHVFRSAFSRGDELLSAVEQRTIDGQPDAPSKSGLAAIVEQAGVGKLKFEMYMLEEGAGTLEETVASGSADLAIRVRQRAAGPRGNRGFPDFEFIFARSSPSGRRALEHVERRILAARDESLQTAFRQAGIPPVLAGGTRRTTVSAASTGPTFSLTTFIPLVLILMTVTGAVYPAIDLTAGERERGTLEILVAAPVPRLGLLLAKFTAVLTVALLTAAVNLTAMLITLFSVGLDKAVFGGSGSPLLLLAQIVALLIVFAAFFSAVLLCLTSFARSFKEAQAYLIPVMLLALAPGVFSLTPGLQMNVWLAVVPLVNIVLIGRDVLTGGADPVLFGLALVSTIAYGLLALAAAARIFGTDAILYGSSGSWSDLFRRPRATGDSERSLNPALLCLAVLFAAFVWLGSLPGRLTDASLSTRLAVSAGITISLFVLLPLAFARWERRPIVSAFGLRGARWIGFAAAAVLGVTLWPFAYEIEILTLSAARVEALEELFGRLKLDLAGTSLAWKLTTLAFVPAVCEELFFRGYLCSAFRGRMTAASTVLSTAALFAAFHVLVRDALFVERFLPSLMMGLALGFVRLRTGSVAPGVVLHALHNGLLLSAAHFESDLQSAGVGVTEQTHLPWWWLLAAAAGVATGFALLKFSRDPEA